MISLSYRRLLSIVLFVFCFAPVLETCAQSKSALEAEKKEIQRQISRISKELATARENANAVESIIKLQREKIAQRSALIRVTRQQVQSKERNKTSLQEDIATLESELETLKQQVVLIFREMQMQSATDNTLLFLLDSEGFQDLYRRYSYLQQYGTYRERQQDKLISTQEAKEQKAVLLEQEIVGIKSTQLELEAEKKALQKEEQALKTELAQRSQEVKTLEAAIRKAQRQRRQIESSIADILKKERLKNTPKQSNYSAYLDLPQTKASSRLFSKNKGQLPWPVRQGKILHKFGKRRHPTLPNITQTFNGLEIESSANEPVLSVFKGTVSGIFLTPIGTKSVVVRQGAFVCIYSNLKEVFVSQGASLAAGETIGLLFAAPNEKGVLNFQMWEEKTSGEVKHNPEQWLRKQ